MFTDHTIHHRRLILLLLGLGILLQGCFSNSSYRSAIPLKQGQLDVGVSTSLNRITLTDNDGESVCPGCEFNEEIYGTSLGGFFPVLSGSLSAHTGIVDDLEAGLRWESMIGLLELSVNWRVFQHDKLHIAIQPTAGLYNKNMSIFYHILSDALEDALPGGFRLGLPIVATYELNDNWLLNGYLFGQLMAVTLPNGEEEDSESGDTLEPEDGGFVNDTDSTSSDSSTLNASWVAAGVGAGFVYKHDNGNTSMLNLEFNKPVAYLEGENDVTLIIVTFTGYFNWDFNAPSPALKE